MGAKISQPSANAQASIERNRASAAKLAAALQAAGPIDAVADEIFDAGVEALANGNTTKTVGELKQFLNGFKGIFSDFKYEATQELASADGNSVTYEGAWSGLQSGPIVTKNGTFPASNKRVENVQVSTNLKFNAAGKIVKFTHFGTGLHALGWDQASPKALNLGDNLPNYAVTTTKGSFTLHEYIGNDDSWLILFSHPADFTPVCTTELSTVAKYKPLFDQRKVKLIAISCDSVDKHNQWIPDIGAYDAGAKVTTAESLPYPIIADENRDIAFKLGMLDAVAKDDAGIPLAARAVFIFGPDKKLKLSLLYPATTGRNFDEIIRVVDSLQLTAQRKLATPANWVAGGECVVVPSVSTADAKELFKAKGVRVVDLPSKKEYLRFTADPR